MRGRLKMFYKLKIKKGSLGMALSSLKGDRSRSLISHPVLAMCQLVGGERSEAIWRKSFCNELEAKDCEEVFRWKVVSVTSEMLRFLIIVFVEQTETYLWGGGDLMKSIEFNELLSLSTDPKSCLNLPVELYKIN